MKTKKSPVSPASPAKLDLTRFFGRRSLSKPPAKSPVSPAKSPAKSPADFDKWRRDAFF